jgi:hypothetical protein
VWWWFLLTYDNTSTHRYFFGQIVYMNTYTLFAIANVVLKWVSDKITNFPLKYKTANLDNVGIK